MTLDQENIAFRQSQTPLQVFINKPPSLLAVHKHCFTNIALTVSICNHPLHDSRVLPASITTLRHPPISLPPKRCPHAPHFFLE
jgi:hypothetical protein